MGFARAGRLNRTWSCLELKLWATFSRAFLCPSLELILGFLASIDSQIVQLKDGRQWGMSSHPLGQTPAVLQPGPWQRPGSTSSAIFPPPSSSAPPSLLSAMLPFSLSSTPPSSLPFPYVLPFSPHSCYPFPFASAPIPPHSIDPCSSPSLESLPCLTVPNLTPCSPSDGGPGAVQTPAVLLQPWGWGWGCTGRAALNDKR